MDVTQIHIKINQTTQLDAGKSNSSTQTEAPVNSFDQVLAMINILGRVPESEGQSVESPLKDVSDSLVSDQGELTNLSADDLSQLESILMALLAEIQQKQNSPSTLEQPTVASESQPSNVSTMLSPLQQVTTDGSKELGQWLQKMEGIDQTSTLDQSQLVQRLAQFIGELQTQEKQNSIKVPNEIGDKIQMILDESKAENKIDGKTALNSQSLQNGMLVDDKKQAVTLESKPRLSMDKNQVIFSSIPDSGTSIHERNKLIQVPLSNQTEDLTKSNGPTFLVNPQLQGPDGGNVSKTVSPPSNLPVSDFVPEVSEWIGRYMRITNGQSGGTEAKFSLYPENLGHIEIKIISHQGQVSAQIVTDTAIAKEALEGQVQQLRQALQQNGLLVQKLDIVQQPPVTMDSNQANLSFSQGGSSSSQEQRTFTEAQDESKKLEETNQKEIERERLSITYGGATPKTASLIDFSA